MAYGMKVYGSGGDLIIDDAYDAYVYLGTYSLTWKGDGGDPYNMSGSLYPVYHNCYCDIVSTSRPIVFYKPPRSTTVTGNTLPYCADNRVPALALSAVANIGGNTWRCYFVSVLGGTSEVKAFVKTGSRGVSSDAFGIRVYKPDGAPAFDSGWKPLNPLIATCELAPIQINISNTIGTAIQLNVPYQNTFNSVFSGNYADDIWISGFTSTPTILTYVSGQTPLYYTYIIKCFTWVTSSSYTGIFAWNAVVNNSAFPTYNVFYGTNESTYITVMVCKNMGELYT